MFRRSGVSALNSRQVDEMWLPTTFNRATYLASRVSVHKVHVVLLAVDTHDIFHPLRVASSDVWMLLDRTVFERPKYVFMSVSK